MLSSGLLYLSLILSKQLVFGARIPSTSQIHLGQCTTEMPVAEADFVNDFYHPESTYETYGEGLDVPSSFVKDNLQDTAVTIVQDKLGLTDGEVAYTSGYSAETADYAYLKQAHNGIPFVNAVANLVLKDGKIVSFGSSFVKSDGIAPSHPSIQAQSAIRTAEHAYHGKYNGHPLKLEYFAKDDGSVALVHTIQIQNNDDDAWYEVYVDAHSGEVIASTNFVAESGYHVVPLVKQNIFEAYSYATDPQDTKASPLGWHNEDKTETKDTSGNNVVAFIDEQSKTTSESEKGHIFKYEYNTKEGPKAKGNPDAATTNAFFIINSVHDFTYRYGFTEKAFNFQTNNFGKGGEDNDRVLMSVQNNEGYNNAKFATPPDGQSGTCKMYMWTTATPNRDGDLDNSVIVHEMTHGISNRMTGGGTARCLANLESKGMGEGWSDTMADWTEQTSSFVPDYTVGRYVTNKDLGTRQYPYSVDPKTNPLRYSDLNQASGVHQAGQIWANMLHNVYAALVKKHGFNAQARTNPDGSEGNVVFLHLFLDSLATQPCFPTFATSRDAWIQADKNRYKGANKCLLWKVFASRGLGMDAQDKPQYKDGEAVPSDCKD